MARLGRPQGMLDGDIRDLNPTIGDLDFVVKKNRPPNGIICAKCHQHLTPDLIVVAASPGSGILNQSVRNFLVSTNLPDKVKGNLHDKTPASLREGDLV